MEKSCPIWVRPPRRKNSSWEEEEEGVGVGVGVGVGEVKYCVMALRVESFPVGSEEEEREERRREAMEEKGERMCGKNSGVFFPKKDIWV